MKKFAKIAAIPIAVVAACPSALALQISDDESALRFRLKMSYEELISPARAQAEIFMPGFRVG